MALKKVCCFIDGFNLYHSIADLIKKDQNFHGAHYLKWINLRALASAFIKKQEEALSDVLYFSAYAYWLPSSKKDMKSLSPPTNRMESFLSLETSKKNTRPVQNAVRRIKPTKKNKAM